MTKPVRKLRGHRSSVLCCIPSISRPGNIFSSDEDGRICWFDLRCKDAVLKIDASKEPMQSICLKPRNEDIIFVSSGNEVKSFALSMASSGKMLQSYNFNKEEINQIVVNKNQSLLAAADDSGEVKVIDINQNCVYKTLRTVHGNICSSVQFLPWKPWEVITGGLDSKLVRWDFAKGRPYRVIDSGEMNLPGDPSVGNQAINPPFIHALTLPEDNMEVSQKKICAVARGDGMIVLLDVELETAEAKAKCSTHKSKSSCSNRRGCLAGTSNITSSTNQPARSHVGHVIEGHTAAVSCVSFSLFGSTGRFLISGGNDTLVKVWELSRQPDVGNASSSTELLSLSINIGEKVNWLCTTPSDAENLVVCDTSKVMKIYTIS